jgi:hypothetical protein
MMPFKRKRQAATGAVGAFEHLDVLIDAVKRAKDDKHLDVVDVFTPVPVEEVVTIVSPKPSPVKFVTFTGALFGITGGFALSIITALIWNMVVGGKPVTNPVPFVVVGFEALVLFGALATLLAILIFSRLPYRQFPGPAYRESFSKDEFGLWVACKDNKSEQARAFLEAAGAKDVAVLDVEEAADV